MNKEFSWTAAREARLDRAIDRAVREMMQVDPPPGLRRRVLARLNESGERRRHFLPRFAFAAAALVGALLAATQLWYRSDAPTPPRPPDMAKITALPAKVPPTIRFFESNPAPPLAGGQITREPIRMPRVTNVFGNRPGEVSATTIEGRKREIVARPLTIVPLSARPIVIAPLVLPPPSKGGQ
jgi:hypothetical protein